MQIEDAVIAAGADISSKEWQFALKNMYVSCSFDVKSLDCSGAVSCVVSKGSVIGSVLFRDMPGYIIGADTGLMILCPKTKVFPVIDWISGKDIRAVEQESRLFRHYVRVRTNDAVYTFRTEKSYFKETAELVSNARM